MGAEGHGLGEGGVLRKSSAEAGRSLTVDTRGVESGDGGDGTNTSRLASSSSPSSSSPPPPSSFQPVAGGGSSGRLVDGRGGGGVNLNQQGGIQPARRTIGQAFRPGELECECLYSRRFLLYHRLRPKTVLSTLANSTLESFRVQGRSGLYVCPDKEGDVFYMTLMEVRRMPNIVVIVAMVVTSQVGALLLNGLGLFLGEHGEVGLSGAPLFWCGVCFNHRACSCCPSSSFDAFFVLSGFALRRRREENGPAFPGKRRRLRPRSSSRSTESRYGTVCRPAVEARLALDGLVRSRPFVARAFPLCQCGGQLRRWYFVGEPCECPLFLLDGHQWSG